MAGLKLAVLCIVGLLVLCSAPAAAEIAREGVLTEEVIDDFAEGRSTTAYALKARGQRIRLSPTDLSSAAAGDRVVVTGMMREGELVGELNEIVSQAAEVPAAGPRKVAVLLIKFPGDAVEPWSPNIPRERVFTGSSSANAFYQEETYGRISLTGKLNPSGDIFGWFTLNAPAADCPYLTWRTEAKAAAEAAGISLAGYDHIVYVNAPRPCGANGIGEIGGTQTNIFGNLTTKTYTHELGHNLGLHHASSETCTLGGVRVQISDSCTISEYGDIFDVMGIPNTRHNNSVGLEGLGVLAPENTQTVTANGIYGIKSALFPTLEPTTLRIPRATSSNGNVTSWYYLEVRGKGGVFENVSDASMTGVSIRIASVPTSSARTILLDANPATTTFSDAPLPPGKAFEDDAVRIETLTAGAGNATVAIIVSPDGTPPSAPAELSASLASPSGVALTWSASPEIDTAKYAIFRDGSEIGTSTTTSFLDSSPAPGSHTYVVYADDLTDNRSPASAAKAVTVPDRKAPSAPTLLSGNQAASGGVVLTWFASDDDVGVTDYILFRDGGEIGAATETSFVDPNPPVGLRTYRVYAQDAAGNRSIASSPKALTVADRKAPSAPTQLSGSKALASVALSWTGSSDNVGVDKYILFRDGSEIGTSTTTSFVDPNPQVGLRTYRVYAQDAAGNRSVASEAFSFTVPAGVSASPSLPALAGRGGKRSAPRLYWRRHVDGRFSFTVDATKDARVVRVGLWIDGRRLRIREGQTLAVKWDPANASACAGVVHIVIARAYDLAGRAIAARARLRAAVPDRSYVKCRFGGVVSTW